MTTAQIKGALEVALNTITPAISTSYENVAFTPPDALTPFQIATTVFATPDNAEYGASSMVLGVFYVRLQYPLNQGTAAALARAELVVVKFKRAASFAAGLSAVVVSKTPEINIIGVELDRFAVLVKIPFHSYQGA